MKTSTPPPASGLRVESDRICEVWTFERPASANAIDRAIMRGLAVALDDLESRAARGDGPRGLVLTATPRDNARSIFLAGADLSELESIRDMSGARKFAQEMTALLRRLEDLPLLVVAAINGDVYGGGCELVTACDVRVAERGTELAFRQTRMGLTTGWGGATRLVRLVGLGAAKRLLLVGLPCPAEEAHRIGLVDELVDSGTALERARELVAIAAQGSKGAVAALKAVLRDAITVDRETSYARELERFVANWAGGDHAEALTAWRERRPPRF